MATLTVHDAGGGEIDKMDVAPAVFEAEVNLHCVRAAVNRQLARRRVGSASTKNRAKVRGGGAKPWRQKGTGRARAGSNTSPLWRGGGTVFGPTPRHYGGRINRKVLRSALVSCLSDMVASGDLIVLDAVKFESPKTRQVVQLLAALKIDASARVLFITETTNFNLALSARNLPQADVINCDNVNTYDLTTHDVVIATAAAVKRLEEMYS